MPDSLLPFDASLSYSKLLDEIPALADHEAMARKSEIIMSVSGKNITDPLDKIAHRGYGFARVYDDFLSLSCHALAEREREYMEIIRSYPNDRAFGEREADYFKQAFHAWQAALQVEYKDYLGEIYEQRVSLGENGQFFTPEHLCELMAAMTAEELKDGQRVYDPACGSGRTLLTATRRNRLASFHGIDLDQRCVKMTALNLLCRNVDGWVVWGNTISLDAYGGYELTRTPFGGKMEWFGENRARELITRGLTERVAEPVEVEQSQTEDRAEVQKPEQYSLML
ncbi:N6 adenine-specific DNA methylase protein [Rhizobium phaseoli]|uniref:N-6 DNA methylase n=1 Tax=Rhizobium phaseoli TaxID=396 RepID=UPI0007E9B857|nr:N-6 DNA methylase [Rhizobium phaseoli]ANL71901.1 N6 adenine-specific DNA methylase protein [Rhizobium phaseoli]